VLSLLGALVTIDLLLFVVMMVTAPTGTRD
jgi:hypothetical protein